jgi:hypothetical protein
VKLATDEWEVNVRLSATDIRALVGSAHWHERGSMRAGESAGAPVFWASDGKQARLLIGHDDETRDVAITIPFRVVDEVVRGANREPAHPPNQAHPISRRSSAMHGLRRLGKVVWAEAHAWLRKRG